MTHSTRKAAVAGLTALLATAGDSRVDLRFGIDRAGALYVLSKANGKIWKVTATQGAAP